MSERLFEAWSLPEGVELPDVREQPPLRSLAPSAAWVEAVLEQLAAAARLLHDRPAAELAETIGRVGARFLDSNDALRTEALEHLPHTAGLSPAMAEYVLDGMARDWTGTRLRLLLEAEFGDPRVLDGFVADGPRRVRALGRSPALHIGAGSVPGVSTTSLIRGLLVRSAVLLKPGAGDVVLPVLFRRGLRDVDPELAEACAVAHWAGGALPKLPAALRTVVVYGDDDTVRTVRTAAPAQARVVEYPHRVSFVLVGAGWTGDSDRLARQLALAAAAYERRGCVSPQRVLVEERERGDADRLGALVASHLEAVARELPPPEADVDAATLRRQWLTTLRMRQAGEGAGSIHDVGGAGVVIVDPSGIEVAPPGRVLLLQPVPDSTAALDVLARHAPHLQSVALEAVEDPAGLTEDLLAVGALRVTTLEHLVWPPAWWHHDGSGPLIPLVDLVDSER